MTRASGRPWTGFESRGGLTGPDLFQEVASIGDEVERGFLRLIFDSDLKETAQRFGIF